MNERVWFYNLQEGRPHDQVNLELAAMLDAGPLVVAGAEAFGYRLARVRGYTLIRDTTTQGRANLFAYVRDPARQLQLGGVHWDDMHQTWTRTQHPGRHAPRALLTVAMGRLQLIVGHAPPLHTDNVVPAQQEYASAIVHRMRPRPTSWSRTRPRLALADWNRRPDQTGPGPSWVAREVGGQVHGRQIDCAVVRQLGVLSHGYEQEVEGVQLHSDHHDAFTLAFAVTPAQGR